MKKRYRTKIAADAGKRFIIPQSAAMAADLTYDAFITKVDNNTANVGDFIIYNPTTGVVYTTALTTGNEFAIAQALGNGEIHFTNKMVYKPMCLSKTDLVKGSPQAYTYTVTSAATAKGQEFELTIADRTDNTLNNIIDRLEFVSVTGAETAAQVAAGIKAHFDSRFNSPQYNEISNFYTVTVAGAVLTITAKDNGIDFGVFATSDFLTGTLVNTVAFSPLIGDGEQVFFEEIAGSAYEGLGVNNKTEFQSYIGDPVPFSKKSCTYDAVTIIDRREWESIGGVPQVQNFVNQTVLFIESDVVGTSGSDSYTALETIFGL